MSIYFKDDTYADDHLVFSSDYKYTYNKIKNAIMSGEYTPEYYPQLFPGFDGDFDALSPEERLSYSSGKEIANEAFSQMIESYSDEVDYLNTKTVGKIIALANEGNALRVMDGIGSSLGKCILGVDKARQMEVVVTELDELAASIRSKDDPDVMWTYTFRVMKDTATDADVDKIRRAFIQAGGNMENAALQKCLYKYTEQLGPAIRELKGWEEPERSIEYKKRMAESAEQISFDEFRDAISSYETITLEDGLTYMGYLDKEEFDGRYADIAVSSSDGFISIGFMDLRNGDIYTEPTDIDGKQPFSFKRDGFNIVSYTKTKEQLYRDINTAFFRTADAILKEEGQSLDRGWTQQGIELQYYLEAKDAFETGRDFARDTQFLKDERFLKRLDAANPINMTKRYITNPEGFIQACVDAAKEIDINLFRKDGIYRMADLNTYNELSVQKEKTRQRTL